MTIDELANHARAEYFGDGKQVDFSKVHPASQQNWRRVVLAVLPRVVVKLIGYDYCVVMRRGPAIGGAMLMLEAHSDVQLANEAAADLADFLGVDFEPYGPTTGEAS